MEELYAVLYRIPYCCRTSTVAGTVPARITRSGSSDHRECGALTVLLGSRYLP